MWTDGPHCIKPLPRLWIFCCGMADCTDKGGQTALHHAAKIGYPEIVERLLSTTTSDAATVTLGALRYAAPRFEILRHGADVNWTNKNGRTSLLLAAKRGHGDVMKLLLQRDDTAVNTTDKDGRTALLIRREDMLWKGCYTALTSMRGTRMGGRLHSFLAERGHGDVVGKMLEAAADPNIQNKDGETPLHIAVVQQCYKDGRWHCRTRIRDNHGRTALYNSTLKPFHSGGVEILLSRGADPYIHDWYGNIHS